LAHLFAVLAHPPALLSDPQRRRADLRGSGVGLVIGEDLLARDIVQACVLVEMVAEVGEDPTSTGSRCSGNAGCLDAVNEHPDPAVRDYCLQHWAWTQQVIIDSITPAGDHAPG
jgi:hypothetical protein